MRIFLINRLKKRSLCIFYFGSGTPLVTAAMWANTDGMRMQFILIFRHLPSFPLQAQFRAPTTVRLRQSLPATTCTLEIGPKSRRGLIAVSMAGEIHARSAVYALLYCKINCQSKIAWRFKQNWFIDLFCFEEVELFCDQRKKVILNCGQCDACEHFQRFLVVLAAQTCKAKDASHEFKVVTKLLNKCEQAPGFSNATMYRSTFSFSLLQRNGHNFLQRESFNCLNN